METNRIGPRLEESQDPLRRTAHEGLAEERKANGLDATEALQEGSRTAKERGAQMTGLLREVERQTRFNRVDPREEQLEEQMAEARGPMKGRRKAGTWKGLLNHPKKGEMDLTDARGRRPEGLRGSPPRADRLAAELTSRHLLEGRPKKRQRTTLMDPDRSWISKKFLERGDRRGDSSARADELEQLATLEGDGRRR